MAAEKLHQQSLLVVSALLYVVSSQAVSGSATLLNIKFE